MQMSPEAKRKAEQELREDQAQGADTKPGQGPATTGLKTGMASFLCYVGNWISGVVFLVIEQKDGSVRFHAAQSVVIFGALNVLSIVLGAIPYIGPYLNIPVVVLFIVLWIWLAARAFQGRLYRVPVVTQLAEALARITLPEPYRQDTTPRPETKEEATSALDKANEDEKLARKRKYHFTGTRVGRTLGACISVFWSFVFMIFLNFFSRYIAYYHYTGTASSGYWTREGVLTPGYFTWLPQMNIALAAAVIGHIITIIIDNYLVYETVHIIINLLLAFAVGSLLALFPFDFASISDRGIAAAMPSALRLVLLLIAAVLIITAIVRIVRLGISLVRNDL